MCSEARKLNQLKKFGEHRDLMKDLCQVAMSIIEEKNIRDGVVLLKYWAKKILIRHGNVFYRMYPCHLMKVNKKFETPSKKEKISSK